MTVQEFVWPVRIYYEDTDAGGVVYHANYLRFMERARNEWLRELGWPIHLLAEQSKTLFVVRTLQMKFIRPARLGDDLQVSASVMKIKKASMWLRQEVRLHHNDTDDVLIKAEIELATVSSETFKPIAMPKFLKS